MDILANIKEVSSSIIPLIGAVALIVVIILVLNLIKIVKNANSLLDKTKNTVGLVDESIKKVQIPLDTAVKVSHTIDVAHDATIKGIGEAKNFISKNADLIKEKISALTKQVEKEKDIKEPSPDDIIGGE